MQNFHDLQNTEAINVYLDKVKENILTLLSNFSGTSFPTSNLQVGMLCYRTDENKLYKLTSISPVTWDNIQDKLTFDTAPTAGSTNPVTSGGVKTALDGKLGKNEIATTTTLGIVKGGGNVAIADDGTLSIIKSNNVTAQVDDEEISCDDMAVLVSSEAVELLVNQNSADIADIKNNTASYTNRLQRNKTYSVGDIAYSPNLPSWAYLECTTAGTTGATEPAFSTVTTKKTITILSKFTVSDGTCTWRLRDTRCKYEVGDIIPKVGSPKDYEYLIMADGGAFDAAYTELAKVFTDGKVPNLQDGRFLEGGANARQIKGAGLPNITGMIGDSEGDAGQFWGLYGAFYGDKTSGYRAMGQRLATTAVGVETHFDASRSNPIYGSSDTVQPKSYTVNYYICYGG